MQHQDFPLLNSVSDGGLCTQPQPGQAEQEQYQVQYSEQHGQPHPRHQPKARSVDAYEEGELTESYVDRSTIGGWGEGEYEEQHRSSRRPSRTRDRETRSRRSRRRSRSRHRRERSRSRSRRERSRSRGRRERSRSRSRRERSRSRERRRSLSDESFERWDRNRRGGSRDFDRDDPWRSGAAGGPRRSAAQPSSTLFVQGIPSYMTEADIASFFSGKFEGVVSARVSRDRSTGELRGFAFVDFFTVDDARAVMESEQHAECYIEGQPLKLEYSLSRGGGAATGTSAGGASNWQCQQCQCINFAREEQVEQIFSSLVRVKDVKLEVDKATGVSQGFAYVRFHSTRDASRALNELQGATIEGQTNVLRLSYADDRKPSSCQGSAAEHALAAANFASQYTSWEPKAYDGGGNGGESWTSSGAHSSGFQYDPTTGYYYDSVSGYYYDPNTGLYCNANEQQWYRYNADTRAYEAVGASQHQTFSEAEPAGSALATQATPATVSNPSVTNTSSVKPKKGAVIGAAPQLSVAALQAKAKAAKAKLLQKKAETKAAPPAATSAVPPASSLRGVFHESKRGGPNGVIYQGKWRDGAKL